MKENDLKEYKSAVDRITTSSSFVIIGGKGSEIYIPALDEYFVIGDHQQATILATILNGSKKMLDRYQEEQEKIQKLQEEITRLREERSRILKDQE